MSIEKLFGDLYKDDSGASRHPTSPGTIKHPPSPGTIQNQTSPVVKLHHRKRFRFRFRLPKVPPKFILFCVLVFGVFYLMHLGYQSIPKKFPLQITSQKSLGKNTVVSYTTSEKPQFNVTKPEINPFLASIVRTVTNGSGDGIRVKLVRPDRKEIAFRVNTALAESGKKKVSLIKKAFASEATGQEGSGDITVTQQGEGVGIGFPALGDLEGQPRGRYVVDVTWEKDGIQYNSAYAFSWGVLVMNTERDRYQTGELVKVGLGMVDDRGHTICGGDVTAVITSPTGKKVTLKTPRRGEKDGQLTQEQAASLAFVTGGDSSYIATSSECADRSITDNPDYSFQFTVPEKGKYTIDLSATTENGTERISQQFEVVENNVFVIARSASMRIYPLVDYEMRISLLSKEGYQGKVVETVPHEFGITCESCTVAKNGETKLVTWDVSLAPNIPKTLTYTYNPPDVSPALFFTGPLVAGERREQRRWAIAFDAIAPQVTLTQRHYIFEDDDGADVNSNTDITSADSAITDVKKGERITARFQVDNTSSNNLLAPSFELFYDRNDNIWTRVEASGSAAVTPGTGNCTDTNWNCGLAASTAASSSSSIAIDSTGTPWVAYTASTASLNVATYVGSGGNCGGSGGAWSCSAITTATNVSHPSIAITASGSAIISYADTTNTQLKVAKFLGSGGNCTNTAWSCESIDRLGVATGTWNAIVVDSTGTPWISYRKSGLSAARYVGSGGTGCSAAQTAWTCYTLAATVTSPTSIAVDASGDPWIGYIGTSNALSYARYVGSGGNCTNTAWNCDTIDSAGSGNAGNDVSLKFDASGTAWLSYTDSSNALKVATYVGSGGDCTSALWNCSVVDSSVESRFSSLVFDNVGKAWIAYHDLTNQKFKVATYVGSGGNCTSAVWNCGVLDGSYNVGLWTGAAFDPTGNAWVSYFDLTNSSLKVARVKRGGEIVPGYGLSGNYGDALTTNTAGSCTGGTTFANGIWVEGEYVASSSANLSSLATNKCTEIAYMIDTSRAIAGTTYRLRLHNSSPQYNLGLNTYSQDPTFTIVSADSDTLRASKDDQYALTNCTDTTWGCGAINSNAQLIAREHSMGFDASGSAWISSFDNWNSDLWVSRYVGTNGGGCGSGVTAWKCTKIEHDALNSIGEYNSIAFNPAGKAYISYYERAGSDLRVAEYVGSGGSGCGATPTPTDWTCYEVDTNGAGGNTSIAFDEGGNPWISHFTDALVLRLARYVGSGGTGCANTAWTCYVVDSNSQYGRYTTIKFDQNNTPWIAYTDQSNNAIRIAQYVGSGGGSARGCGTNSSTEWACETIDDTATQLGRNTSMAIDSNNAPWVAYYENDTADNLWVAQYVGTGGSGCTASTYSGKWNCVKVDDTGDVGSYNAIAIGPDDRPWVSYQDTTSTSLAVAKYVGSGGDCDTVGAGSDAWTCMTVDNQSTSTGGYTSIAFDPSGVPWVASSDMTAATWPLKVAKLHYPYFDNQLRYSIDDLGYTAIASDDQVFDPMAALTNTPMYRFSSRYGANDIVPTATWKGKSSVAASTDNILLQAYRFGTTNAWETLTTNSSCGANLGCTVIGTPAGTLSEYFDADGSNYWVHYRTYQAAGTSKTLQTGYFNASLDLPTQVKFTTGQREVSSGVCSGASVPFTIALQDNDGIALQPSGTTVIQVTSDSSSYAIYSDSSCSSAISGGNISFTTSDTSKTFYLIDSVRGTHVLTATKTSGPETLTADSQYQITDTAGGDSDSTAVTGGANFRGGSTIR